MRTTSPYLRCSSLMYTCSYPDQDLHAIHHCDTLHPSGPGYRASGWKGDMR